LADAVDSRDAILREVADLERICGDLERHLVAGDWNAVGNSLRESRRTTHAFLNAMEAAADVRDEAFDRQVNTRMRRVFDIREDQLERLQTFHAGVGERLVNISRWKQYAGSMGSKRAPSRTAGLDKTR
jgi:hypothetical protein